MSKKNKIGVPKMVISGNVEPDYVKKLDLIAKRELRSRSKLLNMAIIDYVEKHFKDDMCPDNELS